MRTAAGPLPNRRGSSVSGVGQYCVELQPVSPPMSLTVSPWASDSRSCTRRNDLHYRCDHHRDNGCSDGAARIRGTYLRFPGSGCSRAPWERRGLPPLEPPTKGRQRGGRQWWGRIRSEDGTSPRRCCRRPSCSTASCWVVWHSDPAHAHEVVSRPQARHGLLAGFTQEMSSSTDTDDRC